VLPIISKRYKVETGSKGCGKGAFERIEIKLDSETSLGERLGRGTIWRIDFWGCCVEEPQRLLNRTRINPLTIKPRVL